VNNFKQIESLAWDWFSIKRRLEEADKSGVCTCASCGRLDYWHNMDAGHFIPRANKNLKFHSMNVWPQCAQCNNWNRNDPDVHDRFSDYILKKRGAQEVLNIWRISKTQKTFEGGAMAYRAMVRAALPVFKDDALARADELGIDLKSCYSPKRWKDLNRSVK
jgi:hypothetical protein